jgi:hypothetical protein
MISSCKRVHFWASIGRLSDHLYVGQTFEMLVARDDPSCAIGSTRSAGKSRVPIAD